MRILFGFILASSVLMVGCGDLLTLHTLYTEKDQVFDSAIEGRWQNPENILTVTRAEDRYECTLQANHPGVDPSPFEMHLVDVQGGRFADMLWEDQIGHMILRVRQTGDQLRVAFLDSDWLRNQVPHDNADLDLGRKQAMLTNPTAELKKIVAQYAAEERAYDNEVVFSRAK